VSFFMQAWFSQPWLLLSLGVLPVLALLAWRARRRRRRALILLGSMQVLHGRLGDRGRWRVLRGICAAHALAMFGVAAAGPRWGRDWEMDAMQGRDLVVVLDCSRSMLAEAPSRLERARKALIDLCNTLEQRGGHRLGLVLFAARPRLVCPLTHDCDHVRELLGRLDELVEAGGLLPKAGDVSGTRIGAALQEAVAAHDPRFQGSQDIVLLSDGDDPVADFEWRTGAVAAHGAGIAVYTFGLGDPNTPSPILMPDGPLKHAGHEVKTALQEAPLREIARQTRGSYFAVHTQDLPLGSLYCDSIAAGQLREESEDALPVQRPRYWLFLLSGCLFLALAIVLPDPRPRALAYGRIA
jgi:Ca-activated chloride channel family protein